MKKILAALSVSLAFVTPAALAQNAATAAAPAQAAAADPAALAAAHELFEAMNYRAIAQGMLQQMRASMPAIVQQTASATIDNNPKLDANQKKAAREKMNKELPQAMGLIEKVFGDQAMLDEMLRETEQIYARHYSVDELRQITAFYKTPVGAKMLATMPQLMGESMQISQRVVMPRVTAALQSLDGLK